MWLPSFSLIIVSDLYVITFVSWTQENLGEKSDKAEKGGWVLSQGFGSGFNQVSGSGSIFGIRIRIQEGKDDPEKKEKIKKFHVLKC